VSDGQKQKGFHDIIDWLRLATPIGIFVLGIYINQVYSRLTDIDQKLFRHLTNDELHCPRTLVLEKAVFDMYVKSHERELGALQKSLEGISIDIRELTRKMR